MKFCDVCDALMLTTKRGYECPKCGEIKPIDKIEFKVDKNNRTEPVYKVKTNFAALKVRQVCPKCGNNEAYRRLSNTYGEHAGVKSERSIKRYKCTKCGHSWTV